MEEQYYLAKEVNISIIDSEILPDIERKMYISLLIRDKKEENRRLKGNKEI